MGKWTTLNANCQKFNAIYKRLQRLTRSGENEVDLLARVRQAYRDESKRSKAFAQDGTWNILKEHVKWDAPNALIWLISPDMSNYSEMMLDHVPSANHVPRKKLN